VSQTNVPYLSLSIDSWHNIAPHLEVGERAPNFVSHATLVGIAYWDLPARGQAHHSDPVNHGAHWDKMWDKVTPITGTGPDASLTLEVNLIHGTFIEILYTWFERQGCLCPFYGAMLDWRDTKRALKSGQLILERTPK